MAELPPGFVLIVAGLLVPLLPARLRGSWSLLAALLSCAHLALAAPGSSVEWHIFGYTLQPVRVDGLALVFGWAFHLAAVLAAVFALHVDGKVEQACAGIYAGAAVGAVFAGDLVTLFVFWELTAMASMFLIWSRGTESARKAGLRYAVVHIFSGVLVLDGAIMQLEEAGSLAFGAVSMGGHAGPVLLLAFGIKAALPLLHAWLPDAYPESTPTGGVYLAVFTTKMAVYALARGFAGLELLVTAGAAMALLPVLWALVVDDLRRLLSYGLISGLGFMVVAIGVGSPAAVGAAAGYAFVHVLVYGLLFMALGAVLHRTGTARASELGGLWGSMRTTAVFCLIGVAAGCGLPGLAAYPAKTLLFAEVTSVGGPAGYLVLLGAAGGAVLYLGFRLPFTAFWAEPAAPVPAVAEVPWNMKVAMAGMAGACVLFGVAPGLLTGLLPAAPDAHPFSASHLVEQLQFLAFAAFAWALLMRMGLLKGPGPRSVLDVDWVYRVLGPAAVRAVVRPAAEAREAALGGLLRTLRSFLEGVGRVHGPQGIVGGTWTTAGIGLWAAVLLVMYLLVYFR